MPPGDQLNDQAKEIRHLKQDVAQLKKEKIEKVVEITHLLSQLHALNIEIAVLRKEESHSRERIKELTEQKKGKQILSGILTVIGSTLFGVGVLNLSSSPVSGGVIICLGIVLSFVAVGVPNL